MTRTVKRAFARACALSLVVDLASASPATFRVVRGALAPTEGRLGDAVASAFSGVTLPIAAAVVVGSVLVSGAPLRAHVDRLVAAGLEPRAVIGRPLALALAASALSGALAGGLTLGLLRAILHLGPPSFALFDVLATGWAVACGALAWTGLASAFAIRSGRPARAWSVVAIDLLSRLLPGGAAWLAPSAHVGNLLGAPPPRGLVPVPALPQGVSVAVLLSLALVASFVAARRYQGARA